jgi:hypothetical protein
MQPIPQTPGQMGDNLKGLEPDQNRGNHVPLPPPPQPPPYERGYPDAAEVARYLTEAMALCFPSSNERGANRMFL